VLKATHNYRQHKKGINIEPIALPISPEQLLAFNDREPSRFFLLHF